MSSWVEPTRLNSGAPIVAASGGGWHDSQTFDNNVIVDPFDSSKLLLIFCGMAAPVVTGIQSIGRAVCTPGSSLTTWTEDAGNPLLVAGTGGAWDNKTYGVRADSVVQPIGTTDLWLYYTADNGNTGSAIGLATSSNSGQSWTKYAGNPIFTHTLGSPADEEGVSQFSVIQADATHWHALYSYRNPAAGTDHVLPGIRYASSSDGLTWTKVATDVLSQGPKVWEAQFMEWKHFFKLGDYYYVTWETGYAGPSGLGGTYGFGLTGPFGANIARSLSPNTGWVKSPLDASIMQPSGVVGTFDRFHSGAAAFHLINGTWYDIFGGANIQDQRNAKWAIGIASLGSQTPADTFRTSVSHRSI